MKRSRLRWFIVTLTVVLVFGLVTSTMAAKKTLRLGGVHGPTAPETVALEQFAKFAEEMSGGSIVIKVYPASQLGDAVTMIENVMMGAQDMFANVSDWNSHLDKDWSILAMPFAFQDRDHVQRFLKSDVYAMMKQRVLADKGIRVLTDNWYRLPKVLVTKSPVIKVSDLDGKKLRMPELPTYVKTWQALGARPTVIPWAESYMAMRTGVVEGMDSPISSLYAEKFYTVAPNVLMTNHLIAPFNILISERVFQSLTSEQQQFLTEAAYKAGDYYTQMVEEQFVAQKEKMVSEGAIFRETDLAPFAAKAREAALQFEKEGLWSAGLFDTVQQL